MNNLAIVVHKGLFTSLYKTIRSLGKAGEYVNATIDVIILADEDVISSNEFKHLSRIDNVKMITQKNEFKWEKVIFLTGSTIMARNYFSSNIGDLECIAIPRYLVTFGNEFAITDLLFGGDVHKSFIALTTYSPSLLGVCFSKSYTHEILKKLQTSSPTGMICFIQKIINANIDEIQYIDELVSFVRVDKLTSRLEVVDFYAPENKIINRYIDKVSKNRHKTNIYRENGFERLSEFGVGQTILDSWKFVNTIEPQLRPSHILLDNIMIDIDIASESISKLFFEILKKIPKENYSSLVLLPHVRQGGADKAAEYLIQHLAEKNRVLIITTEPASSSTVLNKYDNQNNVMVVDASKIFGEHTRDVQLNALRLIIGAVRPDTVDICNSQLGYWLFSSNFRNISAGIDWYIHAYAHVYEEGYKIPPFHNGLCEAYPVVKNYITDSQSFKHELHNIYGIPYNKIEVLYIPVIDRAISKIDYSIKKKILWAGRISKEKLVKELLIAANILSKDGYTIDLWGPIDETYVSLEEVTSVPGINYEGVYGSVSEINTNKYDMLLFTTINEGVPNTLIEMAIAGLFIVAPPVGGIPESVEYGINAQEVVDSDQPNSYVHAVREVYRTNLFRNKKQLAHHAKVLSVRHSIGEYNKRMQTIRERKS